MEYSTCIAERVSPNPLVNQIQRDFRAVIRREGPKVDDHRHRFIPLTDAVRWDATVKGSPRPP